MSLLSRLTDISAGNIYWLRRCIEGLGLGIDGPDPLQTCFLSPLHSFIS